uniref:Kazal-like domain-containing protein n=1 Tax=Magallana gigas TaxID=29159 RepID=A0A8W8JT08_MAGGI
MVPRGIAVFLAVVLVVVRTMVCSEQIACTADYSPVCGRNDRTYDNECLARSAGVGVAHKGKCKCACPENMHPVCGSNGVTYDNACLAKCENRITTLQEGGIFPHLTMENDDSSSSIIF